MGSLYRYAHFLLNMNESKIAFIICVNNKLYFQECNFYIQRLTVPTGMEIEVIGIQEAESMCAAYNAGMKSTDARYKIYMHQDVFIQKKDFLEEIVRRFQGDKKLGMIGMVGGVGMPKTGVTYLAWNRGIVDCREPDMAYQLICDRGREADSYVDAIDGLLMATQYDIEWREDLFREFDFYDISQSFEMRRKGFSIQVPKQEEPWVIHDSSFAKLPNYNHNRHICIREYSDFLTEEDGFDFVHHEEWDTLSGLLVKNIEELLNQNNWDLIIQIIQEYRKKDMKNSNLEMYGIMSDIVRTEMEVYGKSCFFENCHGAKEYVEYYKIIRLLLRRVELEFETEYTNEIKTMVQNKLISVEALIKLMISGTLNKKKVCETLKSWYRECEDRSSERKINYLLEKLRDDLPVAYSKRIAESEK